MKTIAKNRRAGYDYLLSKSFEAGIVLLGSEVKSLRLGRASINNSYVAKQNDGFYLVNASVAQYSNAKHFNHDETRPRKLLLKKKELKKLTNALQVDKMSIVPTHLFFNNRGLAKLDIAVGRGKNRIDKRQTIKEREWKRKKYVVLAR